MTRSNGNVEHLDWNAIRPDSRAMERARERGGRCARGDGETDEGFVDARWSEFDFWGDRDEKR